MLRSEAPSDAGVARGRPRFVLYVEGPRDREIMRIWARRLSSALARSVESSSVILGGRQPARALDHFRDLGGGAAGLRGLCLLDRDLHGPSAPQTSEAGLEFFTWPRRHIESYLLVRRAIWRCLADSREDWVISRLLDEFVPAPGDEAALRDIDAKRLLSATGPIAQGAGRKLRPSQIAKTMQEGELHEDILRLFDLLRGGMGLEEPERHLVAR